MERDPAPRRKPIPPIVPPSIPAAKPGETLDYQTPPPRRSAFRRAYVQIRYKYGSALNIAAVVLVFIIYLVYRFILADALARP